MAIHRNTLVIADGEAKRPNAPSHVGPNPLSPYAGFERAIARAQARDVLVGLWKTAIAATAVDEAMSHVGRDAPIEALIREALRRCPKPLA
jgi:hypothetical protein